MSEDWHLAQMNVGTIRYPLEHPRMQGFVTRLDEVNALAEQSPGFVWRLQGESGNATDVDVGRGESFIVNMSVWESIEHLFEFVYRSAHREVMILRRNWFEKPDGAYQVLWWVPAGHRPSAAEGLERLARLQASGPGPQAFGFRDRYPPPGAQTGFAEAAPEPDCSGWD